MLKDRVNAAQKLADELKKIPWQNPIVVALPRGGVPMGEKIAKALDADLEIIVPRKIGHPTNEEYAIGALAEGGAVIWNESEHALLDKAWEKQAVETERRESQRRREVYGLGKPRKSFTERDVILIDDGIATGLTMKAAISTIKEESPRRITVAIPVGPAETVKEMEALVDKVICLEEPTFFMAIGNHYETFPQTTDHEVVEIMKKFV